MTLKNKFDIVSNSKALLNVSEFARVISLFNSLVDGRLSAAAKRTTSVCLEATLRFAAALRRPSHTTFCV